MRIRTLSLSRVARMIAGGSMLKTLGLLISA
jgi:hypothetical protein